MSLSSRVFMTKGPVTTLTTRRPLIEGEDRARRRPSQEPEVGNGFPRDGTDGEWKIAGRDAILTLKDGLLKLATAEGDETTPTGNITTPYFTAVRDALDHWRRGAAPPISARDCARAVRLIDQAYELAARSSA